MVVLQDNIYNEQCILFMAKNCKDITGKAVKAVMHDFQINNVTTQKVKIHNGEKHFNKAANCSCEVTLEHLMKILYIVYVSRQFDSQQFAAAFVCFLMVGSGLAALHI